MAAVYFVYEIEGIEVEVFNAHADIFQSMYIMCFIVGGIYAIAMFLDKMLYSLCGSRQGY